MFDTAKHDLDNLLQKDRLQADGDKDKRYGDKDGCIRKTEYNDFLIDLRGERKITMGVRDVSYEERPDKKLRKKVGTRSGHR